MERRASSVIFSKNKTSAEKKSSLPLFFNKKNIESPSIEATALACQFHLDQPRFAALADLSTIQSLQDQLIDIDITDELKTMTAESNLEICVPVLGVLDLLKSPQFKKSAQPFATTMAINGYCAKPYGSNEHNYPRADFVLVTDIVGNQYELVVNPDGSYEIPKEGTGLFSMISAITFIYNAEQVKSGLGLHNACMDGVKPNKLYMLGPVGLQDQCHIRICVSHVLPSGRRIVDTIRTVQLKQKIEPNLDIKADALVSRVDDRSPELLNVSLGLVFMKVMMTQQPHTLSVTLDKPNQTDYSFNHGQQITKVADSHGWMQHAQMSNVFTKYVGLQEETFDTMVRKIYTQYDFMKDYLQGENFELSNEQGYNNFLLLPEALGNLYHQIVHDVVHHQISGEFILDHVDDASLAGLDISQIDSDFHDSVVLSQIHQELQNHDVTSLKSLLTLSEQPEIQFEHFQLYSTHPLSSIPTASVQVDMIFDQDVLSTGQGQDAPQLQFHEVLTPTDMMNHEFQLTHPHQNLAVMVENQGSWTPMMDARQSSVAHFVMTDNGGSSIVGDTPVQVTPRVEVEIDPSHIHNNFW